MGEEGRPISRGIAAVKTKGGPLKNKTKLCQLISTEAKVFYDVTMIK